MDDDCSNNEVEGMRVADMDGVQGLFDKLDVRMNSDNVLVGIKRLVRKVGERSRPLLIIFRRKADRDFILESSKIIQRDRRILEKHLHCS